MQKYFEYLLPAEELINRWCKCKEKPHSICIECGFVVTPTGFTIYNPLQS